MSLAGTRVDPRWLALRGDADDCARTDFATPLAAALARFLTRTATGSPVRLLDVGAGTGAGASWLRPRLPMPQDWRLVDLDADLLARAPAVRAGWARPVVADIAALPGLLAADPADAVTCQALLDLLRPAQLRDVLAPAVAAGVPLLLAVTVTGEVTFQPAHPDDHLVAALFDAHQRRAGRLGPDAAWRARDILVGNGYDVAWRHTPWRLGPRDGALVDSWLRGRAAAAAEQEPGRGDRIGDWLTARLACAGRRELAVAVDHVDLLGLPPR